jgi:hypothetical protein
LSKFRIYRADTADPKEAGRRNKKFYTAYVFLGLLVILTINVDTNSGSKGSSPIIHIALGIMILIAILLFFEMKKQSRSLYKIGFLEFTKSAVTKHIGDLALSSNYDSISRIEIERHLRDLSVGSSKTGSLTHIIKIVHKDLSEENFIISDRSMDFGQKISVYDTLKTLKNINQLSIDFGPK